MSLAYSLASVSQHAVYFQVTFRTSKQLETYRLFIQGYAACVYLPPLATVPGKDFLTAKRVNDINSKSAVVGNGQNSVS